MVKKEEEEKSKKSFGFRFLIILIIVILVIAGIFFSGLLSKKQKTEQTLDNPLKDIIAENTKEGKVNYDKVVEQGVLEFNEDYINYLLIALGVNSLQSSLLGYGNPVVEFIIDEDIWGSEIINNNLITKKGSIENEDLIIRMSKEEAVKALLSPSINEFMKNSVKSGNTKIEMIANKVELLSKGYLDMYNSLTGKTIFNVFD